MYKKFLLILFLIIVIGVVCCLKFCLAKNYDDRTVLQFASWGSESEIKILTPLLSDFEKENPDIKIQFMHIPQNYFQKIHLLFASNTAPDVIFMNNHYLPVYANAGLLEDLSEQNKVFEFDEFYSKSLDTLSWDGKIYAVPRDISNLVIYYNKNLFDKYNIPYPNDNWSLEDMVKISQKLTHSPDIFGISFEEEPIFYLPYLMAFGAKNLTDFEDVKIQKGLNFYSDLRKKYHIAPFKEESASATMAQMFLQGRIGMHLSGRWLVPKYRQEANFDWDIAPFPTLDKSSALPMDASGWAVAKSSKHKPEALKLIKYLSSKESSEKFAQSGLIVPARIDSANSEYFLDRQKPKNAKVFLSIIETSTPTPVVVNFREVLDEYKSKTEYLFN